MIESLDRKMTIAKFLERDDFEEFFIYELIDGSIFKRPSSTAQHQEVLGNLLYWLHKYIKINKLGQLILSPLDVYLSDDFDLVVPDLTFTATENLSKIKEEGIFGAPNLIIEILWQNTAELDKGLKKERYALDNNQYELKQELFSEGKIESFVLPELNLDLKHVFA
jgi:Uma2 family endonuclease